MKTDQANQKWLPDTTGLELRPCKRPLDRLSQHVPRAAGPDVDDRAVALLEREALAVEHRHERTGRADVAAPDDERVVERGHRARLPERDDRLTADRGLDDHELAQRPPRERRGLAIDLDGQHALLGVQACVVELRDGDDELLAGVVVDVGVLAVVAEVARLLVEHHATGVGRAELLERHDLRRQEVEDGPGVDADDRLARELLPQRLVGAVVHDQVAAS